MTWELDAGSATYSKEDDLMHLEGVEVKFYSEQGAIHTVRSDYGDYNGETGFIEVAGDVRVDTKEGYTLRTERLRFISSSNKIKTDEVVEFAGSGIRVVGTGFEMEIESGSLKMLKDVRTYLTDASL